jgi:uncharacterized repeat protein (TIGR03803 family)
VASSLDQGGNPNYGVAYEVIPPRAGETKWTKRAIYSFKEFTDGAFPYGGLIAGSKGTLFGATIGGGASGQGTVVKLSAPTNGAETWAETTLYSFNSGTLDGHGPYGTLLLDGAGNLFGTTAYGGTSNAGTVFELSPPSGGATTWTESILYNFGNAGGQPRDGLIFGPSGTLFGTTGAGSVVFQLLPPTGAGAKWSYKQVFAFNGPYAPGGFMGSLLRVSGGDLYGLSTQGGATRCQNHFTCGTVYEVTP